MAGRGYVKLHRDVMDHPIFGHEGMLRLWCYCLLRANWKDSQWLIPGTLVSRPVNRGQFITGGNSLYEALYGSEYKGDRPSVRTIWRWLEALRDMHCITMETLSSRCTLVTVCNYETYQSVDGDECQADDTPASSSCHAGVTPVTTNKETKKLRNQEVNTPQPTIETVPVPPELSREPFPAAWGDWLSYRNERRLSTRARTIAAQLTSLAPLGPDAAAECLRLSIRNGWQGIFPERMNLNGNHKQPAHTGPGQRYRGE